MAWDLGRLASYVRFYLTVKKQLDAAWAKLDRTHGVARDALAPFAEPLARLGAPVLTEAIAPFNGSAARELSERLFGPEDEEALSGIHDVYEVVGRFSFQGEANGNLARVQALVSSARNEIVSQRMRLADLAKLPDVARAVATRLQTDEGAQTTRTTRDRIAGFDPLAEQVGQRAKQTLDAVKSVAIPDLADANAAAEDYRRFVAKLDQVYQTCLPFLRKAIAALYAFAGAETTASWPDTLPLVRELPSELVSVPPLGSPELSQARASLQALGEEEIGLARARDEIATAIARLEGELGAAAVSGKEIEVQLATATQIIELASAHEAADRGRASILVFEKQKADLVRAAGLVWQRHRQIEASLKLLEEELGARANEIAAAAAELEAEKKDEPVLFGKDDWRARVAALEAKGESLRALQGERINVLGGLKIDLSRVSVEVQTEQQHALLVDRQIVEARATVEALVKTERELADKLGSARPPRVVTVAEAEEGFAILQGAQRDNAQRAERLRGELRRQKEEGARVAARTKQAGVEREQVQAMVKSAEVAATEGHEGAVRHLAEQRRAAVERHVAEVLGTLEKSLSMVGQVFVEPARKIMLASAGPAVPESAQIFAAAEKLGPVLEKLSRELDPDLLSQDAALGQIQREFCDVAANACRAAWS